MFGRTAAGCRRCSTCAIHYPNQAKFEVCDVCETETSYFSNVSPDPEWEEAVKYAKMHPAPPAHKDPHEHRFESYLKMGYNEHQAQALANAVYGESGFPLYHGLVKAALDGGCDPVLAFDMFT